MTRSSDDELDVIGVAHEIDELDRTIRVQERALAIAKLSVSRVGDIEERIAHLEAKVTLLKARLDRLTEGTG